MIRLAHKKRVVSEVQTIRVKKYQYLDPRVRDEPEGEVVQNIKTREINKKPSGGIFGLLRKKKKVPGPTDKAEEFIEV